MTKDQMVKKIAEETGVTMKKAKLALTSMLDGITDALKKKDKVTFIGFGSFSVSQRKARNGKNPKTGAVIKIPAKTVPVFKAGKTLKSFVK